LQDPVGSNGPLDIVGHGWRDIIVPIPTPVDAIAEARR
jgi:hypothetical protein